MSTPSQKTPTFGTFLPQLRAVPRGGDAPDRESDVVLRSPAPTNEGVASITQVTPVTRPMPDRPRTLLPSDPSSDSIDVPTLAKTPAAPRPPAPVEIAEGRAPEEGERRAGDILAGRYRLVKILGEGGMGTVWEAQSLGLDLPVAIKLLHRSIRIPSAGNRLQKEALAASRVVHPASVRVFDFGVTDEGDPFLVMERLRGTPLAERLRADGPLRPLSAVRLLLPVIEALCVAHHEGVIHCDLKPANILLVQGPAGLSPRLIDYGIARIIRRAEGQHVTRRGVLLGSPTYMSPEQIRGGSPTDPRVDVWGASLVLYELCAAHRPFRAAGAEEVIEAILWNDLELPDELRAEPALWSIVERGLQKDPLRRWQSMAALGRALAAWAVGHGAEVDVVGTSIAYRWLDGRAPG